MLEKLNKRIKKNEKGLTLVELLAVVVIIAIVGAIAFILIGNVISNSKKDAHIANAQQIIAATKLAESSGEVSEEDFEGGFKVIEDSNSTIDTLDEVLDPWTKEDYDSATVKKDDKKYKITLASSGDECNIDEKNEKELQQGRDTACESGS